MTRAAPTTLEGQKGKHKCDFSIVLPKFCVLKQSCRLADCYLHLQLLSSMSIFSPLIIIDVDCH
jgi:hypothetical protein